jgi:DNA replication and repair protein RecF
MRILAAELSDFRNFEEVALQFSPSRTVLVGANGQGKTNLLEALYMVAGLRPLRSVPRSELIRYAARRAKVRVSITSEHSGLTHELEVELFRTTRRLTKDHKRCDTTSFLGCFVAVAFTPDDLQLTKGSPELRRRFLDRAILNAQPSHLDTALRYAQALKARTRLLAQDASDQVLDSYDEVLAGEGAKLMIARQTYVAALAPVLVSTFESIATPAPPLSVRYQSTVPEAGLSRDRDALEAELRQLLARRRTHDRHRRSTSIGPHRDDLELYFEDKAVKMRASQGQHRALVLALKLSEIRMVTERLGEPPVLLLDDISSELDQVRSRQLFEAVEGLRGQVILSTTEAGQIPAPPGTRFYDVAEGRLSARAGAT